MEVHISEAPSLMLARCFQHSSTLHSMASRWPHLLHVLLQSGDLHPRGVTETVQLSICLRSPNDDPYTEFL